MNVTQQAKPLTDAQRLAIEEGRGLLQPPSADARFIAGKIVTHMWIIFVLLPVVLAILFALLR